MNTLLSRTYERPFILLLGVLILTYIVYSNTLDNDFVLGWDDELQVVNNSDIKELSSENILKIFSSFYVGMYQPISTLSYAIDYKISNLDARRYHLTNLLLHLANVILVFFLFNYFSKQTNIALFICTLFAIHPMNVESIAWISTRSNLLYSFFYLLALISYVKYLKNYKIFHLGLTFLFFILSLFSKAPAVTLPFLLILFDFSKNRRFNWKSSFEKIPFILVSILFIYIAFIARMKVSHIGSLNDTFSLFEQIVLIAYAFSFYLFNFFIPINLSAIHYYPVISTPNLEQSIGLIYYLAAMLFVLVLVFSVKLILKSIKKKNFNNPILVGFFFFLFTISVVIHFIPIGMQITSDRYVYIPYLGLFYILGYYYFELSKTLKEKKHSIFLKTLLATFILLLSLTSYNQNTKWANINTLMTDVIQNNPDAFNAYIIRADGFYLEGNLDKALIDYKNAESRNPKYENVYINRATVYAKQKLFLKAIDELNTAIMLNNSHPEAFFNRGLAYFNIGDYNAAIADFNKAISADNTYALAYLYRGVSYGNLNQMNSAVSDLMMAVQLDPKNPKTYFNLGVAKVKLKEYPSAIEFFTKSISLKPDYADAYLQRGIVFLMQNKTHMYCKDFNKSKILGNTSAIKFIKKYCK